VTPQSDVFVSAAIMAKERIDSRVPHLLAELEALSPRVVEDRGTPWLTAKAAWRAMPSHATHHLVVQDDVRLAGGFVSTVRGLVPSHPTSPIAFYANANSTNGFRVRMTAFMGGGLVRAAAREWVPSLALLLPRSVVDELLAVADLAEGDDDEVLADLFQSEDRDPLLITVPNLAEHDDEPSTGWYSHHGLRRSASFAADAPPASSFPPIDMHDDGWRDPSIFFDPGFAAIEWGTRIEQNWRLGRERHVPWYEIARLFHLHVPAVLASLEPPAGLLDDGDTDPPFPRFWTEALVACFLDGMAWRIWWTGGRTDSPAQGTIYRDAVSRLICAGAGRFMDDAVSMDTVAELAREAFHAGMAHGGRFTPADVRSALARRVW
jgi:hypothetical protein